MARGAYETTFVGGDEVHWGREARRILDDLCHKIWKFWLLTEKTDLILFI